MRLYILPLYMIITTFYSNYWGSCLFSWLYYDLSPARQKPCFPFLFSVSAKVTSNYLTKRMNTLTSYLESYNTLLIALPNLKVLFLTQARHCYQINFPKTLYCIPFYSKPCWPLKVPNQVLYISYLEHQYDHLLLSAPANVWFSCPLTHNTITHIQLSETCKALLVFSPNTYLKFYFA